MCVIQSNIHNNNIITDPAEQGNLPLDHFAENCTLSSIYSTSAAILRIKAMGNINFPTHVIAKVLDEVNSKLTTQ